MLSDDAIPLGRLRGLGGKGNLRPGRLDRLLARARRPLDRAFEQRAAAVGDMATLSGQIGSNPVTHLQARVPMASSDPPFPPPVGQAIPRVLVASLRGWSTHNAYELVIAQALRLRGARVALLTCGGGLPACELGWARRAHPRPCDRCGWLTERILTVAGLEHYRLGDWLPWGADARRAPLEPTDDDDGGSGSEAHTDARVSTGWLLRATQLDRVPGAEQVARDFAVGADGVAHGAAAILREFDPDVVFLLNGLFAAERVIRRLALSRGARAPTYEIAPRGGALVLSQDSAAPDFDVDRLWRAVRDRPLSPGQRSDVIGLLEDRARGVGAHESYYDRVEDDPEELRRRLELSGDQRVVSLFTNVTWDSATIGHDIGFASMFDWIEQAVRLAAQRELALVVRVHPGEGRWGTREGVQEVIGSRLGELPANVRLISATDALSSYALLDISDLLLTYTTTVGLEAAVRGKRVAVAGETHYRGRGFTTDIANPEDLAHAIDEEPRRLSATAVELATRYAHMFFFRAMIPFGPVAARDGRVERFPRLAAELAPGADPYLDWICERILDGQDFGLPDELACSSPLATAAGSRRPCAS
jgi:Capsule polysaccharide biosynthesis protein